MEAFFFGALQAKSKGPTLPPDEDDEPIEDCSGLWV